MSPILKVLLSCLVPLFCCGAYQFGIVGGTDVVTGAPLDRRGPAFWALIIIGAIIEGAALKLLWL